jgi:peptide/nickel transport system ATP-binding protein
MTSSKNKDLLLDVKDLKVYFHIEQGIVKVVDGVSFSLNKGESLGIVGESGCGKSVTALSLMLLHSQPEGKIEGGEISFYKNENEVIDIAKLNIYGKQIREIRGKEIAIIFQEPMMSLNPVYTIGYQIMEAVMMHQKVDRNKAKKIAIEMLDLVRLSNPRQRVDQYPHEISGGMRQRVMIAIALSCNPSLLIADEPTTALDVTIEAEILKLVKDLQKEMGMSLIMITHDLGVIGEMANEVVVMYVGKIIEKAKVRELFNNPMHPYTQGLFRSRPELRQKTKLSPIRGTVPNPYLLPKGCYFESRCDYATEICRQKSPIMKNIDGHHISCWKYS